MLKKSIRWVMQIHGNNYKVKFWDKLVLDVEAVSFVEAKEKALQERGIK